MRNKRLSLFFALAVGAALLGAAQILTPVKWTKNVKMTSESEGVVELTAAIDGGWHIYANTTPAGGPTPLAVQWTKKDGINLVGDLKPSAQPRVVDDENFGMKVHWWEKSVTLSQRFKTTAPKYAIEGDIRYMCCNDQTCTPPTTETFALSGTAATLANEDAKEGNANEKEEGQALAAEQADTATTAAAAGDSTVVENITANDLWRPVTFTDAAASATQTGNGSLWFLFIACFLGGFLALLTPCVWPIIPLTVSFFLKKGNSKTKSLRSAITYGISIIVIYVALGLLVTAIFGANGLNALATNAICNIVFFLLLVVFAISFLGAFEIKLPDSWSAKMDNKAEKTTGLISIFFMAFTLVIVSFSCTGPIIGTLLVETASSGSLLAPIIGMFAFSLALAIPFTLFALFPSVLKKLPRSGSWLNTVKVVLGFLELALSLKFLSVADLAYGWHILDRETFLALWIAIFLMLGLYLMGMLRVKGDGEAKPVGVVRIMLAIVSLAFTAYLVPGLWGAPLRVTGAFVPPMSTQDFNLNPSQAHEWESYEEGVAAARAAHKPVFLEFSGYGCVNCRKMEAAVFDVDAVKSNISDNFVHVRLMVDDKTDLEKPITVTDSNGRQITLKTVGDKWSYLQQVKFNSNSQPYYVILDNEAQLLAGPRVYDENINDFQEFLNRGKNEYDNRKQP